MNLNPSSHFGPRRAMAHLDAHHRFWSASLASLLTFFLMQGHAASLATILVASWDVFATVTICMAWSAITIRDPYEVRQTVKLQDSSGTFLFVSVVTATTISLVAVFFLLGSSKNLPPSSFTIHAALSVAAIILSWTLVHTLFTLRYAHFYYIDARKKDRDEIDGGLVFPGDDQPDYQDFAYFSFVIGMTCQVSDVQIASKKMRHLATIHGLISFAFNTAILAMFINIIAGLI